MPTKEMWSEEMIAEQIKRTSVEQKPADVPKVSATDIIPDSNKRRNFLVVGCGDGGSMIAQAIRDSIPGTYTICYNTSARAMEKLKADIKIVPQAEDGSGKVRDYSKDVFKQGSYKHLLGNVKAALEHHTDIAYILVTTTTDGGTGSGVSPMVARFIADNSEIPVSVSGAYPALTEDATAQFNALNWQAEVEKIKLPYMIFDNGAVSGPKSMVHRMVNKEIADVLKVITGDYYGNSDISMIDSRNMYMLLQHTGKRIFIENDTDRPKTGQSLDDYVKNMIEDAYQPKPVNVKGIGVFVKGPASMIGSLDTSLTEVRGIYGDAAIQYVHVQESDDVQISVIMAGCSEPTDRLYTIRSRYDDIMNAQHDDESALGDLMSGINNPLGTMKKRTVDAAEPDLSALDI